MIFLLNQRHMPFYKWAFRALGELPLLSEQRPALERILSEPRETSGERSIFRWEDIRPTAKKWPQSSAQLPAMRSPTG